MMYLDPWLMGSEPDKCDTMMRRLLSTCVDAKLIAADTCDDVLSDFSNFMWTTPRSDLQTFDVTNDQIDSSFHQRMSTCHKKARPVVKMLHVLLQGQAMVERGLSINNEVIVENQHVESLVAWRIIKDHIQIVKGVANVDITRSMIVSVRGARARYMNDLSMKRTIRKGLEGTEKKGWGRQTVRIAN